MCFGPLVRHSNSCCCFFFFYSLPIYGSFCRFRVCGCFLCFYQIFIYFLFKVLSGLTAIAFLLTPSPSQCKQKSRFATPGRYRRTIEIVRTINTSEVDCDVLKEDQTLHVTLWCLIKGPDPLSDSVGRSDRFVRETGRADPWNHVSYMGSRSNGSDRPTESDSVSGP